MSPLRFFLRHFDRSSYLRCLLGGKTHTHSFSIEDYEHYDLLQNGDINWIVPGKLLAFSGPLNERIAVGDGATTLLAHDYAKIFKQLNVSCVVRFNEPIYDRRIFLHAGIHHVRKSDGH